MCNKPQQSKLAMVYDNHVTSFVQHFAAFCRIQLTQVHIQDQILSAKLHDP